MKTRDQKKEEADKRNKRWESLSLREKIERIKNRPGGSRKQLSKLTAQLGEEKRGERIQNK